ncbi:lipopolysaccharide biosynthesis protein [Endozoicomonas sp. ALC020]|uniref:lipopolysaccharide biosynthesis protein n=1 Tax=unclassified Endozoicomonas TaxID=2644528 RepID=UPI003BB1C7A1
MTQIRSSLLWSAVKNSLVRFSGAITFIVMARVLETEQLGIFSAVLAVLAFLEIFSDGGISDALIQREKLNDIILNTAFAINIVIALILVVSVWSFSDNLAFLLPMEGITEILKFGSLALLMNAIGFVPQALLRRNFKFKWLAIRAAWGALISSVFGITLVLAGFGVWSLLAQFLLMALVNVVLVWKGVDWRPSTSFSITEAKPLVKFGSNLIGAKVLDYFSNRSVEIYVVTIFGPVSLALYVMGQRLYSLAMQVISAVTVDVYMPKFSLLKSSHEELSSCYYRAVTVTAAIGTPIFIILAILSPEVVNILYSHNGQGSERVAFYLSILGAIQVIQFYNGTLLNAIGRPDLTLKILLVKSIGVLTLMIFATEVSFSDFVFFYFTVQLFIVPASFLMVAKYSKTSLINIVKKTYPFFLASTAMAFSVTHLRDHPLLSLNNSLLSLFLLGIISVSIYFFVLVTFFNSKANLVLKIVLGDKYYGFSQSKKK